MNEEKTAEAQELINLIENATSDLSEFSVYNGDIFNAQIGRIEELVRECRQQLK